MAKFMSKQDVAKYIRDGEAIGVAATDTYNQLRANGWQLEGDPNPPIQQPVATRTPNAFSYEGQQQLEQEHPVLGPLAMPAKQVANFGINAFNMGKQLITQPGQTAKGAIQTGLGAAESVVKGLTGYQVPTFHPDGTVTKDGPTPEQQVAGEMVNQYATNYGVNELGKGVKSAVAGDWKGALQSPVNALEQVNKTMFESPAQAITDYYGAKSAVSGGLKAVGAKNMSSAVDNFHPAETFLNDVVGPVVDNTPFLGRISRGYAKNIDPIIDQGFAKAVRPTSAGKDTLAQREKYSSNARDAVKSIVHNKDQLQFVDEVGEPLPQGSLPQNIEQFSQAIDQTKKRIFNDYNDLQKKAGQQGMSVKLDPIVQELQKIADDPTIQDLAPQAAEYARGRAAMLSKRGQYTTEQAQSAAAQLNTRLQAKNLTPNDVSSAMVDALIKNKLVDSVDNAVLEATNSPAYLPLRKQYAALKSVERDINHRAVVFARQSNKGFFDLSNVFSYGDIVQGLATHNGAQVAKGLVQRGVAAYYRYRNNPNTILKGMFNEVDKALGGTKPASIGNELAPALSAADNLDDVPLSQLSPQGVADAAASQKVLDAGGTLDDAMKSFPSK